MKMLVFRDAGNAAAPFVLDDVKVHCRVDGDHDDQAISRMAWAAALEIEQFAQIALMTQTIRLTIFDPAPTPGLRLPIGPVADDDTPTVTIDGQAFAGFGFAGGNRPYIRWDQSFHDLLPDRLTIEYQAGFGATAGDIPPDLAQAILDQAALHYDGRSPMSAKELTTSPHMARIGARYRGVSA